jgi:PAS domain S-box-containing protein
VEARHAAEVALREREERNRSVLESLNSHIALLDREGNITAVNESWVSFAAITQGTNVGVGINFLESLGREAEESDKKAEEALLGIRSVLEGRAEHFELEYPYHVSSGTLWHTMSVVPFRGEAGGAVVSYTDVTDRRRAEEEAKKRREELAHVARVATMGELTASIAHEINQPLTSIVNYTNAGRRFLDSGPSTREDVRGVLRAIAEQGKRAGDIIRHLRELIRKGEVERVRLDVNQLLGAVLTLVHGDALAKGVSLRRSLGEGLPAVSGNPIELQQVILNLVINGFEAMSQGDGGRELTIRTWSEDPNAVEIALSDTGPPVSEETFQKMFQRFYTSKAAGLGMGLSISQSIAEAHGGRLWAERNLERGLTMRLSLPAAARAETAKRA